MQFFNRVLKILKWPKIIEGHLVDDGGGEKGEIKKRDSTRKYIVNSRKGTVYSIPKYPLGIIWVHLDIIGHISFIRVSYGW